MPHVQGTYNVWWWLHDDERPTRLDLAILCELRLEGALFFPPGIPCGLDGGRVIGFEVGIFKRLEN